MMLVSLLHPAFDQVRGRKRVSGVERYCYTGTSDIEAAIAGGRNRGDAALPGSVARASCAAEKVARMVGGEGFEPPTSSV